MTRIYFTLALLLLLTGCVTNADDTVEGASSAQSFAVTERSGNTVRFVAKGIWYNGCGSFSRYEVTQNDSTYRLKIFGRQPKDAICTQNIIEFDAPINIRVPQSGTYQFRFWKSDSTSLDTTLRVE